uniref:Lipase n=1 Tax=Romanomermis culicivorax TaxID=13658 RepID=A0A915IN51_ROMCU
MQITNVVPYFINMFNLNTSLLYGCYDDPNVPEMNMTLEEIVRFRGYPIERHNVQTSDGYILSMFRIPSAKKGSNPQNRPKEPILLQHGFLATAYNWILNNEDQALGFLYKGLFHFIDIRVMRLPFFVAYVLADNGYDVWLGNIRGNSFSKKHVNYTVLDPEFWDFTWVEMAEYDLPSMIDYILNRTNRSQLIYLGYSQGSLMGFAKFSSDPIYANKVKTFIAMAPVATVGDILGPAKQLARFTWTLKVGFVVGGYRSFGVLKLILKDIQQSLMNDNRGKNKTCDHLYFNFINPNARANLNETLIPLYLSRMPDDTSLKNVAHYGQMISSGLMQKYDYGLLKNYMIYGQM